MYIYIYKGVQKGEQFFSVFLVGEEHHYKKGSTSSFVGCDFEIFLPFSFGGGSLHIQFSSLHYTTHGSNFCVLIS